MRAVVIALAVAISLTPLWQVYQSPYLFVALAGSIILGSLLAWVASKRNWKIFTTTLWSVALFAIFSVPLAVPSQALWGVIPSGPGLLTAFAGLVLSWKQLVTIMPPVGSYEALLIPVYVIGFIGSLLAVSFTLKWKSGAKANIAPLVVLVSLGLAIWLGTSQPFATIAITAGVFALIALWFASERAGATPATFRSLGVIAVALVVAIATVIFVPVVNRDVWRTEIDQPFVLRDSTSPLSQYRAFVTGNAAGESLVSATGLHPGDRLSLATLDTYNGVLYAVGGSAADFTKVPGSIAVTNTSLSPVTATITIDALTGGWVPLPGKLGEIVFSSNALSKAFYYNRLLDTGAVTSGLAQGDSYTATGYTPSWVDVGELESYKPGNAAIAAPSVIPEGLDAFIATSSRGSTSAGQRLQESLSSLLAQGYVSHGQPDEAVSASGHGANRLSELFSSTPMVGDAEQYSATAALIATQAGFPARVVMGFIADDTATPESTVTFTGEHMTAWVEISTTQGWIAVNPNPEIRPIPEDQPEDPNEVAFPQTAVEPPQEQQSQINDETSPENAEEDQPDNSNAALQAVLAVVSTTAWSLLILGILSSPLIVIAWLKSRRRRKRMHALSDRDQIVGAWQEAHDVLIDSGQRSTESVTRIEFAEKSSRSQLVLLAHDADHAQYSLDEIPNSDPQAAWARVREFETELAKESTLRKKLSTKFSLSSLGITSARLKRWFTLRR